MIKNKKKKKKITLAEPGKATENEAKRIESNFFDFLNFFFP